MDAWGCFGLSGRLPEVALDLVVGYLRLLVLSRLLPVPKRMELGRCRSIESLALVE